MGATCLVKLTGSCADKLAAVIRNAATDSDAVDRERACGTRRGMAWLRRRENWQDRRPPGRRQKTGGPAPMTVGWLQYRLPVDGVQPLCRKLRRQFLSAMNYGQNLDLFSSYLVDDSIRMLQYFPD